MVIFKNVIKGTSRIFFSILVLILSIPFVSTYAQTTLSTDTNVCLRSARSTQLGEFIPIDKNGVSKSYYQDGNLKNEAFFIKKCKGFFCLNMRWIEHGKWKFYDEKGKLIKEETWERGSLIEEKSYPY
ncbi:MAG: hypothetical protein V4667_01775 [Bacteroidota bacterium]